MDQLLNGRLEYWHRLSFFNETDGLKKARRYLSPNFGCHTVNILEEYRKLLQNAYRRSERNYPPTIDDTSFLIHSSLLKSVLQNLVYVASLSKITLVPVQAIYNAKATPKRSHSSSGDAGGQVDYHGSNQGKRNVSRLPLLERTFYLYFYPISV
ncbi:hypothetical protein EV361DRAFT_1036437 [Lentinula raphanica]|nr:hypothetical protein EV361DRAFT_1036437 [Lentinula raphanica]